MVKYLDYNGLKQVLGKLTPLNGNSDVVLPSTATTAADATALKTILKTSLLLNSQLANVSKKQFNVIQFYTSASGLVKDDDSVYFGYGYYIGNGSSTVADSMGMIKAYVMGSNSSMLETTVYNNAGTLS